MDGAKLHQRALSVFCSLLVVVAIQPLFKPLYKAFKQLARTPAKESSPGLVSLAEEFKKDSIRLDSLFDVAKKNVATYHVFSFDQKTGKTGYMIAFINKNDHCLLPTETGIEMFMLLEHADSCLAAFQEFYYNSPKTPNSTLLDKQGKNLKCADKDLNTVQHALDKNFKKPCRPSSFNSPKKHGQHPPNSGYRQTPIARKL